MKSGKTLQILLAVNAAALITLIVTLLIRDPGQAPALMALKPSPEPAAEDQGLAGTGRTEAPVRTDPAPTPATNHEPAQQGAAVAARVPMDPCADPLVPMAFVAPQPEDHLDPAQLKTIREDFVTALQQGPQLNPNSPEYLARWIALKDIANDQFNSRFGTDAYLKYQGLARQAGIASVQQNP